MNQPSCGRCRALDLVIEEKDRLLGEALSNSPNTPNADKKYMELWKKYEELQSSLSSAQAEVDRLKNRVSLLSVTATTIRDAYDNGLNKDLLEKVDFLEKEIELLKSFPLKQDEITIEFFRKYLEIPDGNLETLCREILRRKELQGKLVNALNTLNLRHKKYVDGQITESHEVPDETLCPDCIVERVVEEALSLVKGEGEK